MILDNKTLDFGKLSWEYGQLTLDDGKQIGQWKTAIEQGETNIWQWETDIDIDIDIDKYINICIDTNIDIEINIDNVNTEASTCELCSRLFFSNKSDFGNQEKRQLEP